jgi:hypothetical protein
MPCPIHKYQVKLEIRKFNLNLLILFLLFFQVIEIEAKEDLITPDYQNDLRPQFNPIEYDFPVEEKEFILEITNGLQINQLTNPIYKFLNEDSIYDAISTNLTNEVCFQYKFIK